VIIQVTLCGYPVPGKNSITHEMSNTFPCRHLLSGYVTFEALFLWNWYLRDLHNSVLTYPTWRSSNIWSTMPFSFQYVIYLSQTLIPQVTYLLQPRSRQVHKSWDALFGHIRSPVHLFTIWCKEPSAMQSHVEFVKTVICSEEMAVNIYTNIICCMIRRKLW
jgi:hypothetical protein